MTMSKQSDPDIPDLARYGDDLLARIDELTSRDLGSDGNGWRNLLLAAGCEIGRLRAILSGIEGWIQEHQRKWR